MQVDNKQLKAKTSHSWESNVKVKSDAFTVFHVARYTVYEPNSGIGCKAQVLVSTLGQKKPDRCIPSLVHKTVPKIHHHVVCIALPELKFMMLNIIAHLSFLAGSDEQIFSKQARRKSPSQRLTPD